ncbi:MAG: diacylglycerol kinase family lipid kinase [Flavobacteriales bacterium]|nr:diacylglycerol kinase family lipid kinase [Flavobacteriales bacterium]
MKVVFILNGSKKISNAAKITIDKANDQASLNCFIVKTESEKHAIDLGKEYADKGVDFIIAVGGDGTCNEVVNGIQKSTNREKVIFGIIPNGSGNDFHRMLGRFSPENFISALIDQNSQRIDLIKIESNDKIIYSLNIAGVGFDGFVVNKLNQLRKNTFLKGKMAYAYSILRAFFSYKKPDVVLSSNDYNYSGKMMMIAVCNGTTFGHGMIVSPNAKLNDGKLNITLLGEVSLKDYVKNISRLKKGILIDHPEVHYFETMELMVSLKKGEMYLETDGEIVGQGDVRFQVLPNGLNILLPEN